MGKGKKAAHPVAAPVHRRLELARLLEVYLADSLTNDEVCDRLEELLPEPRGDGDALHFPLWVHFEDAFKTRTFRQWSKKRQVSEREFLERVILFLRSDLEYVETDSSDIGYWSFLGAAFLAALVTSCLSMPDFGFSGWSTFLIGLIFLTYVYGFLVAMLYNGLSGLWNCFFGSRDDDEAKEYWPFTSKADYLAQSQVDSGVNGSQRGIA